MFSTTPLFPFHIRSAVKHPNYTEIMVQTEHLKYQVVVQGALFMVIDSCVGRMISTEDPMWFALNQFLSRNDAAIKEVMS
jgi:hypothetical protein